MEEKMRKQGTAEIPPHSHLRVAPSLDLSHMTDDDQLEPSQSSKYFALLRGFHLQDQGVVGTHCHESTPMAMAPDSTRFFKSKKRTHEQAFADDITTTADQTMGQEGSSAPDHDSTAEFSYERNPIKLLIKYKRPKLAKATNSANQVNMGREQQLDRHSPEAEQAGNVALTFTKFLSLTGYPGDDQGREQWQPVMLDRMRLSQGPICFKSAGGGSFCGKDQIKYETQQLVDLGSYRKSSSLAVHYTPTSNYNSRASLLKKPTAAAAGQSMQVDDSDSEMQETTNEVVDPEEWFSEYLSLPKELRACYFR